MIDLNLVDFIKTAGTAAADRVHTGNAVQKSATPFVVIRHLPGGTSPRTLDGRKLMSRAPVELNAIADNYTEALGLMNQLVALFDNFRGLIGTLPAAQTDIRSARLQGDPADNSEVDGDKIYRRISCEILFVYLEA